MTVSVQDPINSYTGNGSTTVFAYTFRVDFSTDIDVYLDGTLESASNYTVSGVGVNGGGDVTFTAAPGSGVVVRIQRAVPLNRTTDYQIGGSLNADTLDKDVDRNVMMLQDIDREVVKKVPGSINVEIGGGKLVNVADPTADQDGATKKYGDTNWGGSSVTLAAASATNAQASAAAALTSENNAATSETNSATSETNAATSETNAGTSAAAALVSENNAATSETNAATSETNAGTSETNASNSASAAGTSETNAATSETNAATSASNASTSASNASTSETNAATSASNAATSETNSATSAAAALVSENNAAATLADAVMVTGDTMTGTLVLNADPSGSLDAATKQYVDNYSVPVGGGTFTGSVTATGGVTASGVTPFYNIYETDGPVDEKRWQIYASGGQLQHRMLNDANSVGAPFFVVDRTGNNIDALSFRIGGGTSNAFRIDNAGNGTFSGVLGIGVTPRTTWPSDWDVLQFGDVRHSTIVENSGGNLIIGTNYYNDGAYKYVITSQAARYYQSIVGTHVFQTAPSGTADTAMTWSTSLELDNAGVATFEKDVLINSVSLGINNISLNAWSSNFAVIQLGGNASFQSTITPAAGKQFNIQNNVHYDGAWKYISTDEASNYYQVNGKHIFRSAPVGTAGTAPTWTQSLTIDANGIVTNQQHPSFLAQPTATQANFPVASWTTVAFGAERFDVGGNFASNTFTAPVTGKYQLNLRVRINAADSSSSYYQLQITTSNRSYLTIIDTDRVGGSDYTYLDFILAACADMDVNDTAYVRIYQASGTSQSDIITNSFFSGFLVA